MILVTGSTGKIGQEVVSRLLDRHAEVEAKLRASPLAWTILQPGMFAQNLLMSAQTIRGEGRFFGAYGEGKIAPIDVRDIAEVAVLALTTEGHEGKTYRLTGPEALTHRLLAEKLSAATGKKIEYVNLPADVVREGMKKAFAASGMPLWLADDLVKMQEGIASGGAGMVTDEGPRLLGRPARTFDDFARDQAAAFGG